ncbi:MAG: arginine--tRNA ligase [Nanoarchaeota archaeon]
MKEEVVKLLKKILEQKGVKLDSKEIEGYIEVPPSAEMGDYAFPCFFLAGKLKDNPAKIAAELRKEIKIIPKGFSEIKVAGPYVNFYTDKNSFAEKTISDILIKKNNFGKNSLGKNIKTMIEFSQPNTHKAFHVGHIRGTSIGESLSRISEFSGEKIIRANYSGDTGMHIAKWIWCYNKYHSKEKLKDDEAWIASIYVDAVKKLSENPDFQKEVDEINKKLESRADKKINELWKKTRILSIKSWNKIYKELNTRFDVHFFESEVEKRGKELVADLIKKGVAEKSQGAIIVDLNKYDLGVFILLRSDGTVLYSSKDLALAEKKLKEYKLDKSIVVVGSAQDFYFKQLFKVIEIAKLCKEGVLNHIPFSEIRLPAGKMSSRTGENIIYSDFMSEMLDYSKKEILKRAPKLPKKELERRAIKISVSAIKYSILKQNSNKSITFRKEDTLNFDGDTGPYILYSYARACSILKKVKAGTKQTKKIIKNLEQKEIELVRKLSQFPEIVISSYQTLNPSSLANYSYQLSQIFNEFYHDCPVIGSENESFRLSLVKSFKQVLRNSLYLLGIETVERM